MNSFFSAQSIKTSIAATLLTLVLWAFISASIEVLYPIIKGVKWSNAGLKLFVGLARMFAIYFVKNGLISAVTSALPLFIIYLCDIYFKNKIAAFSSTLWFLVKILIISIFILGLLTIVAHFTSLMSFKYTQSYIKAFISISLALSAGFYLVKRKHSA